MARSPDRAIQGIVNRSPFPSLPGSAWESPGCKALPCLWPRCGPDALSLQPRLSAFHARLYGRPLPLDSWLWSFLVSASTHTPRGAYKTKPFPSLALFVTRSRPPAPPTCQVTGAASRHDSSFRLSTLVSPLSTLLTSRQPTRCHGVPEPPTCAATRAASCHQFFVLPLDSRLPVRASRILCHAPALTTEDSQPTNLTPDLFLARTSLCSRRRNPQTR